MSDDAQAVVFKVAEAARGALGGGEEGIEVSLAAALDHIEDAVVLEVSRADIRPLFAQGTCWILGLMSPIFDQEPRCAG